MWGEGLIFPLRKGPRGIRRSYLPSDGKGKAFPIGKGGGGGGGERKRMIFIHPKEREGD